MVAAATALLTVGSDHVHALGRHDARGGDECRAQVNANFDAREAEMRAHGNHRGIAVMNDRQRAPALADCEQLDRSLRDERMMAGYQRLSAAVEGLRAGRLPAPAEQQALDADHEAIVEMPPAPYREAYLRLHADYQRYRSVVPAAPAPGTTAVYRCTSPSGATSFGERPCEAGSAQAPLAVPGHAEPLRLPGESCQTLRERLAESRREHEKAVDALLAGTRGAGEGWRAAEMRRQAAVSDLRWYGDRVRMLGCGAP